MVGSKLKYLEPLVQLALALWLNCHVTWHTLSIGKVLASLIIGHHSGSIQEMMRAYGKYHPCKSSVVRANERVVVGGLSKQRFLFLIE